TIDLGFAWTTLPSGATVAFVDVPGHERFVPNMLAGVGPVPAALVVVAADEGWMPQSAEHLAALDALGVRYGLVAVTRSDLADPGPAMAQAREHLAASTLGDVEAVAVSGATGAGLDALKTALDRRGDALVTPDRFQLTDLVDVRLHGDPVGTLPPSVMLHAGSAAVTAHVRPLGTDTARLQLSAPLPLRIGDRALLRDPGRHHVAGGVTVLDVVPPPLRRRGSAAARAAELSTMDGTPDEAGELRRRGLARRVDLTRMGVPVTTAPVIAGWHADPARWQALRQRLAEAVARYRAAHPLEPGAPVEAL